MKKILLLITLFVIYPSLTFAAWWNPLSWSMFNKEVKKNEIQVNIGIKTNATSTYEQILKDRQKKAEEIKSKILDTDTNSQKTYEQIIRERQDKAQEIRKALEAKCNSNYSGCLKPNSGDYDCVGGTGNGPNYTGTVQVLGYDEYGLDRDRNGWGCE
jgi:DNA-directed RNA polymerase beta' subunit